MELWGRQNLQLCLLRPDNNLHEGDFEPGVGPGAEGLRGADRQHSLRLQHEGPETKHYETVANIF